MTNTPEQIVAANKAGLEALIELSQKSFAGVEKLVELNLQTVRASLSESADNAKALLSVKDAQELFTLQSSLLQPNVDKATAYARQVYEIASGTQAEVTKLFEAQFSAAQQQVATLVDTAVKNAPAGSESAVAALKSALSAANNAFDGAQKAAKQAISTAEANFEAMAQSASKAAASATPKAVRRAA